MNSPEKIIESAISNFGGIDVLVCDYGSSDRIAYASENWEETCETGYYQVQRLVLSCWPYFKQQRYGRIVLATTGDGVVGPLIKPSYVASKMGIVGLSQDLAKQGRADNILCNAYLTGPSMLLTRKDFSLLPGQWTRYVRSTCTFYFFPHCRTML
ncbi:hypothetical protein DSO57_1011076 [Entomophthora muscae]|uniref:Uncharacterized protein n=1 Tax=Entomophthora muscae TaxID=34485 RepID=A0ACC2TUY7_9FUNG|nr:hypothetical protein DSO57_1011076 [Entomophthora muscae]